MTRFVSSRIVRDCLTGVIVACLVLGALPASAKSGQPAWPVFVDRFIEMYFVQNPSFAVRAGRHEFDGQLPDWGTSALKKRVRWLRTERKLAARYRDSALTEAQRFERQYLLSVIDEKLFWLEGAQSPYRNPMYYSSALDPNVYLSRSYAPVERRMRAFIDYARNVPKAAKQIRANLRTPFPATYIDLGKTVFGGMAKFYENDAKLAFAAVSDSKLQKAFAAAVPAAARSMRDLSEWMESQRPRATDDYALGAARFRDMLKATEGVDVPLDALEKAGRADLERNLATLTQVCQNYAPKATVAECVDRAEASKPKDGAVAEARRQLVELKAFVAAQNLVSIPSRDEAAVAESPPYNRWNLAYIDIPGPYERDLPSTYYVAPPDPAWSAAEREAYVPGKANLLFVSAHEVWPGHFLQRLHSHRAGSKFGQLFGSYAFSEGWAHYAEELMWEAGLNSGDPETHIGQLINALLRNVRFLSAIGLHTQGMSVAASEKMFRELAFRDAGNARQQAARGTFDPAYLNYTLGKLMIRKLREQWTASRGNRVGWKAFHDAFLSYGSPPIPLVRKAMLPGDTGPAL